MALIHYDSPFRCYDAASNARDYLRLSGPAPVAPTNPGVDPWFGDYGPPVDEWTDVTHPQTDPRWPGHSVPNKSWRYDELLPAGWYTRIREGKMS